MFLTADVVQSCAVDAAKPLGDRVVRAQGCAAQNPVFQPEIRRRGMARQPSVNLRLAEAGWLLARLSPPTTESIGES